MSQWQECTDVDELIEAAEEGDEAAKDLEAADKRIGELEKRITELETERIPVGDGSTVLVIPAGLKLRRLVFKAEWPARCEIVYRGPAYWTIDIERQPRQMFRDPQVALDWLAEEYGK